MFPRTLATNDDEKSHNTHFKILATRRVDTVPDGDPRRIVRLVADPKSCKDTVCWYKNQRLGYQEWASDARAKGALGALSNLHVSFDRKGGKDLGVMAIKGTCSFSVVLQHPAK